MTPLEQRFSQKFSKIMGGGYTLPFAKGRTALYAGLKALDLPKGAEVMLPAYTCVVVPAAIQFAGLKPTYIDIRPDTYNIDVNKLPENPTAKVLIVQHSYGICADMTDIVDYCQTHGIILIEDCCHAMTSTYNGQLCGTFGDFAFFSGQWNKYFSSGLGGFFFTQNKELAHATAKILKPLPKTGFLQNLRMSLQIMAYNLLVRPQTTAMMTKLYRTLSRHGVAKGSSNTEELQGTMPDDYLSRMTPVQLQAGIKALDKIKKNMRHRYRAGEFFRTQTEGLGFQTVPKVTQRKTTFLRYPVKVKNKQSLLANAANNNIELGDWFNTPLHGNEAPLEHFGYETGSCPIAEQACAEVINLPTHMKITQEYADQILDFLQVYAEKP